MEKNMKIFTFSFVLSAYLLVTILPTATAAQYQIGISPIIIDAGVIERGESKRGGFVITTNSNEGFMVNIKKNRGSLDFFDGKYNSLLSEYSEEDASSWVNFLNVPIYMDVDDQRLNDIKSEQINFIIKIPEDAEPGYHLIEIIPNPETPSGWSNSLNIVGLTKINMLFRVAGEAERNGEVLVMNAKNTGTKTKVDILFKNTGSVSMHAKADEIKIYSPEGGLIKKIWSSKVFVSPGDVISLTGMITTPLDPGSYLASTNVSYATGHAAKDGDIWIETAAEGGAVTPPAPTQEAAGFPWWILILAIIIVGYLIYKYI